MHLTTLSLMDQMLVTTQISLESTILHLVDGEKSIKIILASLFKAYKRFCIMVTFSLKNTMLAPYSRWISEFRGERSIPEKNI